MALSQDHQAEAETCFRQALELARYQQAKSLELRAALSLGRLWQHQGKCTDAYQLLAPIYGWLTEGFDTATCRRPRRCWRSSHDWGLSSDGCSNRGSTALAVGTPMVVAKPKTMQAF